MTAAQVTLIPDIPRRGNSLLLTAITPGHYNLFAWERDPAGAEQNADFMRDYDALGVSVNIAQGLPLAIIQVPLIPAKY